MKTIELKQQTDLKPIIFVLFILIVVFATELFEPMQNSVERSLKTAENLSTLKGFDGSILNPKIIQEIETGKLTHQIHIREQAAQREVNELQNSTAQFSIAKLKSYLIVETEPKLDYREFSSMVFPEEEKQHFSHNDYQLQGMKTEASHQTDSMVNLYAFEKQLRECLIVEKESPLQLENWMIHSKCWCPRPTEPLQIALFK